MDNSAASRKDLEANGHVEDTPSEGSSEQLNPYQKRSRRMEYVYISIAVVLGAALIAVLVYYSVTNAQKDDPVAVSSMDMTSTTTDYDDLFGNIGGEDDDDNSQGMDGLLPSDMTRAVNPGNRVPSPRNIGQTATTESPGTSTQTEEPKTTRTFVILRRGNGNPVSGSTDQETEDNAGDSANANENGEDETASNVGNNDDQGSEDVQLTRSLRGMGTDPETEDNAGDSSNANVNEDTDNIAPNADTDENGEDETGSNVENNNNQGSGNVQILRTLRRIVSDDNAISTSTPADEGGAQTDEEGDNSGNSATN